MALPRLGIDPVESVPLLLVDVSCDLVLVRLRSVLLSVKVSVIVLMVVLKVVPLIDNVGALSDPVSIALMSVPLPVTAPDTPVPWNAPPDPDGPEAKVVSFAPPENALDVADVDALSGGKSEYEMTTVVRTTSIVLREASAVVTFCTMTLTVLVCCELASEGSQKPCLRQRTVAGAVAVTSTVDVDTRRHVQALEIALMMEASCTESRACSLYPVGVGGV